MIAAVASLGPAAPQPLGAASRNAASRKPGQPNDATADAAQPVAGQSSNAASPTEEQMSFREQRQVARLKSRDREVRAHEQAHRSAGGQYAGAASYSYTTGPDGKRYATGGEVPIDASPVPNNPQATVQKMEVVKRAAMAPAQPSSADRSVYAQASRLQNEARVKANKQEKAEMSGQADGRSKTESAAPPSPAVSRPAAIAAYSASPAQPSLRSFAGFVAI